VDVEARELAPAVADVVGDAVAAAAGADARGGVGVALAREALAAIAVLTLAEEPDVAVVLDERLRPRAR
jgi:hypothetical protein